MAPNRTFTLYKVYGEKPALLEAEKLKFENNYFYFVLLGELYKNRNSRNAKINFLKAYSLAQTSTEKLALQEKIDSLR